MTNALLILVGLVEFIVRATALVVMTVIVLPLLVVLIESDGANPVGDILAPQCWRILAERATSWREAELAS